MDTFLDYVITIRKIMDFWLRIINSKNIPTNIMNQFLQGFIKDFTSWKIWIDKRKLHLSNLIISNQISRDEAIEKLKDIPYNSDHELLEDKEYVLKKLNWTNENLKKLSFKKEVKHSKYSSEKGFGIFV